MKRIFGRILMAVVFFVLLVDNATFGQSPPNIILVMADDLGWGDVGFNGNKVIKTPHLDEMASKSIKFSRFYSASPVCSPTRGSCLTGRNAERYGISFANVGHLRREETSLAELLKKDGYTTGHFGKWHLGTLTQTERDGHRGGREKFLNEYSPPWENGFDVCFATEQAVPTWNPMEEQTIPTKYWIGPGAFETQNLEGDDSRVIMDRAVPFIERSVREQKPFFAVIWFHAPHTPVVAGPSYLAMYNEYDEDRQHYYGCITAMDEQVGRLRKTLRELGIADNTIVFFTSDNGPAGEGGGILQHPGKRQQGTAGPFRGRKGSLYEGGIRVPALIEWPSKFGRPRIVDVPTCTSDYFPTIASLVGRDHEIQSMTLDGTDMFTLMRRGKRADGIGFKSYDQIAYMDQRYKLYSPDGGAKYELYDLLRDPGETTDLAASLPKVRRELGKKLEAWLLSCREDADRYTAK